jgi:hypothetical protein
VPFLNYAITLDRCPPEAQPSCHWKFLFIDEKHEAGEEMIIRGEVLNVAVRVQLLDGFLIRQKYLFLLSSVMPVRDGPKPAEGIFSRLKKFLQLLSGCHYIQICNVT